MQNISSVTAHIKGKMTIAELRRAVLKQFDETIEGASTEGALNAVDGIQVELKISWVRSEPTPSPTGETLDELLTTPIKEFGLSPRAANALDHAGYRIVGDVARQSVDTLVQKCYRFGDACVRDTRGKLTMSGLRFELQAPLGPFERQAALDGPHRAYLCPGDKYWLEIYQALKTIGINNLSDLIQANDEAISSVISQYVHGSHAEVRAMRTRLRERGLIE